MHIPNQIITLGEPSVKIKILYLPVRNTSPTKGQNIVRQNMRRVQMVQDGMNVIVSLHMWGVVIIANILIIVIMTGQHHVMKQPFANMGQSFHKDMLTIPNPG